MEDKEIIDTASSDTQDLIEKLMGVINEYISNGKSFNSNTRQMIASRAISAHNFLWMDHVGRLHKKSDEVLARSLAIIDEEKGEPLNTITTSLKFMEDSGYHKQEDSEPEFQMWRSLANLIHPHGYDGPKDN